MSRERHPPRDPRTPRDPRDPRPSRHRHHGGGEPRVPWWLRPEPPTRNRALRPRADVVADLVRIAIDVADAEGLDAVSMRRIARDMGMGTMSLYWYIDGKDDLFDLMFDHLMGAQLLGEADFADWRTGLRAIACHARDIYESHPWMISDLGGHHADGPNSIRHIDQSLRVTDGLGLDGRQRLVMLNVVDDFVVGRLRRQLAIKGRVGATKKAAEEWLAMLRPFIERLVSEEGLDRLAGMLEHRRDLDDTEMFEEGLEVVLDGLQARFRLP